MRLSTTTHVVARLGLLGLLLATGGCRSTDAKPAPFSTLDADAAALRKAFNSDVESVRVVMLVSPS